MSEFEVFSIVLSFILGLGVAQLLSAVVFAIHSRRQMGLSWPPMLWALAIFLFHVNFLFATLWFHSVDREFVWYMGDIIGAVLIFLSGGLILPSASRPLSADLDEFFARDGRLALIPLGLFLTMAIPFNLQGGLPLLDPNNVILVILLAFAVLAFLGRGRLRTGATCGFAALTVFAFLFVWARPGAV